LPYNDVAAVEAVFAEQGADIACVISEAAAGNMGVVPPSDGFNAELRRITAAHGALLVLDEVMTGFRVSASGWYGLDPVDADMFSVFFVPDGRQVRDYDDAKTQDVARYTAFFHEMLARGVYLPPSAFEAWFVNAQLQGEPLDRVLDALPAAAGAAAAAGGGTAP